MSVPAAGLRRSPRNVPRVDYYKERIIQSPGVFAPAPAPQAVSAPPPAALNLNPKPEQILRVRGWWGNIMPGELRLMVYEALGMNRPEETPIPGFPSGLWLAHNVRHPHIRWPTYPEVEAVLSTRDRELPAQIIVDFEHIRELPTLLWMIEKLAVIEPAAASFLDPARYRDIWLRLYNQRLAPPPPLIKRHYDEFHNLAAAAAGQPATVLQPPDDVHALNRFLKITLERLRTSQSSNHPNAPFAPGDLEVVLEIPRDQFPVPDPSNPGQSFDVHDAMRYLHKYSEIFRDSLRLSFTICPSMIVRRDPNGHRLLAGERATITAATLTRYQNYIQQWPVHNTPDFRLQFV
ncbi:hypothetical protein E8E11_008352 [Didymella keratinophila]|nr:hypothetical protein E8E11_008352 [Didymella keratinophila]